jgi:flagellar biogenesis protein FliO
MDHAGIPSGDALEMIQMFAALLLVIAVVMIVGGVVIWLLGRRRQ